MRRTELLLAGAIFVFGLIVFAPAVGFDFIGVDDGVYVTDNAAVQEGLTGQGLVWAFTEFHGSTWVPLTYVSLMIDRSLFGPGPAGFHFTNILLHAVSGALLFLLVHRLTQRRGIAACVALLFVAHPMRVESVAWIAERKDVLSTAFWFLTTLIWVAWVRRGGRWIYAASVSCFALGLASKAMLVTLPLTLLIFDVWPLERNLGWRARIVEKLPFFVLAVVAAVVAFVSQASGTAVTGLETLGIGARVANAIVGYVAYLQRLIWPFELAYYYPHPSFVPPYEGWSAARVVGSGVVLLVISGATVLLARRRSMFALAGWAWYLVTLLPVIGLVQIGLHANADRFSYVPHVGLLLALVFGGAVWIDARPAIRRFVVGVAVVLVIASTALTVRELSHWRSSETLFRRALEVTEDNGVVMDALGAHLAREGRLEEAEAMLEDAVAAQPRFAGARANLGIVLALRGIDDERAMANLREGLASMPEHARAHVALANLLAGRGELTEATEHYRQALEADPAQWAAHVGLGQIARARGNLEAARMRFRQALEAAPDEESRSRVRAVMN